jgi:hypothetical protein
MKSPSNGMTEKHAPQSGYCCVSVTFDHRNGVSNQIHRRPLNPQHGRTLLSFQLTIGTKMAGHQDARYIPPRRKADSSRRRRSDSFAVRWLAPAAVIIVAVALAAFTLIYWRGQAEYSDPQRACIAQRYKEFDAKNFSQCVDVCKACMTGTTVTCTTSCKLKGAS